METVKVQFNPVFKEFNQCRKRYRIAYGSAGSGKSVNIARDYILKLSDPRNKGANLLCVRKVSESNRQSTYAELVSAVYACFGDKSSRYWDIKDLSMRCKKTGNRIMFAGFNDIRQREKVKSITVPDGKLTSVWVEEATELQENDVDILDDRLRGLLPDNLYYQMTLSFNPVSISHWIKAKYFDVSNDDFFINHSTYLDNRFIDPAFYRRMELRKERDPEGYRIYGLGEWGEIGGLILTKWKVEPLDKDFSKYDYVFMGQDFGFNHANAILTIGFKDGNIYILDEIYVQEMDTNAIIKHAEGKINKNVIMFCDSAEPDRIQTWRRAGYRASPVEKEAGSVSAQIDFLKRRKIYVDASCLATIKELRQWKWAQDRLTGKYLDVPVGACDDAMAALRYGIEYIRKAGG